MVLFNSVWLVLNNRDEKWGGRGEKISKHPVYICSNGGNFSPLKKILRNLPRVYRKSALQTIELNQLSQYTRLLFLTLSWTFYETFNLHSLKSDAFKPLAVSLWICSDWNFITRSDLQYVLCCFTSEFYIGAKKNNLALQEK